MKSSNILLIVFCTIISNSISHKRDIWDTWSSDLKTSSKLQEIEEVQESAGITKIYTIIKFHFEWEIQNISKFREFPQRNIIKSPLFSVNIPDLNKEYYWSLGLYNCDINNFGVSLIYESEKAEIFSKLKYSLLNGNNKSFETGEYKKYFQKLGDNDDTPNFVNYDTITNNGLIIDDKLTILCEGESYVPSTQLIKSKYDELLNLNMKNLTNNSLITNDLDQEMLQEILHFFYTGKTSNLKNMQRSLLVAADNLKLRTLLEEKLLSKLNVEIAADIYRFMYLHQKTELKLQVIDFIKKNALQVMSTKGWTSLLDSSNSKMLAEIFTSFAREVASKNPMDATETPAE